MDNEITGPPSQSEIDLKLTAAYAVAGMALWAGDFEMCQARLGEARGMERKSVTIGFADPGEMICRTAVLRLDQLRRRMDEFRKLVGRAQQARMAGLSVDSEHLHGVLWRHTAREFELGAFASDLGYEGVLLARARDLAKLNFQEQPIDIEGPELDDRMLHGIEALSGYRWVHRLDHCFATIHVSILGHFVADLLWTAESLPGEEDVLRTAIDVLGRVDPNTEPTV